MEKKNYKFYFVISDVIKYKQCKKNHAKQVLISYFYLRNNEKLLKLLKEDDDIEIIVDSGLYSFSNSQEIDEYESKKYCNEYIEFIKENHANKNFIGFFELDFDLIGYNYHNFVKYYQNILLGITNKIILIMQKKRTILDLEEMLSKDINTIAIPFASRVERKYFDYLYIIDIIKRSNKRIHLLGCSTAEYLVSADQSDSSSWFMTAAFGEQMRITNNMIETHHYSEGEEISTIYEERIDNNVKEYLKFEEFINNKKNSNNYEIQRLF